jgi:hypothetical protein
LCYCISSFFFSGEKRKEAKKKRHFWQIAPQPKEALLRVLVARVILFVCAGATAPHVLTPLFVFFLGASIFTDSVFHCFFALLLFHFFHCFSVLFLFHFFYCFSVLFLRTVKLAS